MAESSGKGKDCDTNVNAFQEKCDNSINDGKCNNTNVKANREKSVGGGWVSRCEVDKG